jgi:hypothetical protein
MLKDKEKFARLFLVFYLCIGIKKTEQNENDKV